MPTSSHGARPREIAVLSGAVLVEAVLLAGAAVRLAGTVLFGQPATVGGTVVLVVVLLAAALWLLHVGRALWRGFRWPRAAALVVQVFLLVVALPLLQAGQWASGLVPAVPAVVVLVLLFRPAVLAWTSRTVR